MGLKLGVMTTREENMVHRWEKKNYKKIYKPVMENGVWRIREITELQQVFGEPGILGEITMTRVTLAGHLQRMTYERIPKGIFKSRPGGRRPKGRPKIRWLDSLEEDLRRLGGDE